MSHDDVKKIKGKIEDKEKELKKLHGELKDAEKREKEEEREEATK